MHVFQQERPDEDRHAAEQHDPRRIGARCHGDGILFLQHGAERPTHRGGEDEQRAKRRSAERAVAVTDEKREPAEPEQEPGRLCRREPLAEQPHGQGNRDHRHRVAENCGAAGGDHRQAEGDEHVPAGDIEKREQPEASPLPTRRRDALATYAQHEEEHGRSKAEAQRAECPRRHLRERELHRRPVESPGERQGAEQPPQARGQVIGFAAQPCTRTGNAFNPAATGWSGVATVASVLSTWYLRSGPPWQPPNRFTKASMGLASRVPMPQ